jgi:hypothetical protein
MNVRTRNTIIYILLIAIATIFAFFNSGDSIVLSVGETALTIAGAGNTSYTISYADIQVVKLVYSPDYGYCVKGGTKHTYAYGTWTNEVWGRYRLCADTKIDACIVIVGADGVFVFNYTSIETTEDFEKKFVEYLAEKK